MAEEWIRPVHTAQVENVAGTIGCLVRNLPQPLNHFPYRIFTFQSIYCVDVFYRDFSRDVVVLSGLGDVAYQLLKL